MTAKHDMKTKQLDICNNDCVLYFASGTFKHHLKS